ncbi:MAG: gliding motility-associated protein GldE [Bacteroidota bacterium]
MLLANLLDATSIFSIFYLSAAFALILLLFLSAVISGAEVAFFGLTSEERNQYRDGNQIEQKIAALLDNPRRLLATMLIGNHLFNLSFIVLSIYLTWEIVGSYTIQGLLLVSILSATTFILVFFGELLPKVYAHQKGFPFAQYTVNFIALLVVVLQPASWLLTNLTKIIEERAQRRNYRISVEELNQALEATTGENTTIEEKEILKGIVNFGNISAKQIMRPRVDITAFDRKMNFHQLMDKINKFGYSRVPVYYETIDKIEGILYIKDLLPFIDRDEHFFWQELLKQSYFIPESKKIDDLLYDFQEKRVHMAIVVDEYGGTSGLITLEDIIEEIVGEINDEFD